MVLWITGLSGAGKTTLGHALWTRLKPTTPALVLLDGDAVRLACGNDLGFAEADRVRQIRRVQGLAQLLSDQGMHVIVAAVYARPDLLAWNRMHLPGYYEIYLHASIETLRRRDVKHIYARASRGELENVVGLDLPWHRPPRPDLVIDVDRLEEPDRMAAAVIAATSHLLSHP